MSELTLPPLLEQALKIWVEQHNQPDPVLNSLFRVDSLGPDDAPAPVTPFGRAAGTPEHFLEKRFLNPPITVDDIPWDAEITIEKSGRKPFGERNFGERTLEKRAPSGFRNPKAVKKLVETYPSGKCVIAEVDGENHVLETYISEGEHQCQRTSSGSTLRYRQA